MSLLEQMLSRPRVVALDSETRLIARGLDLAPEPACITHCSADLVPGIIHARHAEPFLRELLEDENVTITTANGAYDFSVFLRWYPGLKHLIFAAYRESRIHDIQLNQKLADLSHGEMGGVRDSHGTFHPYSYSLKALYERYQLGTLEKEGPDVWRLRYGELIDTPLEQWPEAAVSYARLDALATYQVHMLQQQFAELIVDGPAQCRKALALQLMSVRGMVTDEKTCLEYQLEVTEHLEKCRVLLLQHGLLRGERDPVTGKKVKAGSKDTAKAKARMVVVCEELGLDLRLTETGGVSLDAEATRDTGDEVLKAYSDFGSSATIISRVEKLKEGSKGLPLQTSWDSLKANGRCGSREPSPPLCGIAMQNMNKKGKMRNCLVARPSYALLSVDFASHELVTVAQCELRFTGKSKLAESLNAGRDVLCEVAAEVLGTTYEDVFANKKVDGSPHKFARGQSKIIAYGGWGFMAPKRLQAQMNKTRVAGEAPVSLERATFIMRAWERRLEPQNYFDAVKNLFPGADPWSLCTIKQFGSGRIRGLVGFPDACNTFFSGLAADSAADACFAVAEACALAEPGSPFYDCHPVTTSHDEIVAEIPLVTLHESAYAIRDLFVATAQAWMPDVKLKAEPAVMHAYDKDADAVFDANGRIKLWEDR